MEDTEAKASKSIGAKTFGKLGLRVRRFGVTRTAASALLESANKFIRLRVLRLIELHPAWIDPAAEQPDTQYRCRFLERHEILAHARDPENPLPEEFLNTSLEKRDQCFGILDGDMLVSFGWYSTRPTRIGRDKLFRFPRRYVYMFHGYTRPAYRGQRLHSLGIARATRIFAAEGHAGVVSMLDASNWASRASAYGLGFRPIGTIVEVGIRRWLKYFVSRGALARECFVVDDRATAAKTTPRLDHEEIIREERRLSNEYAPWYQTGQLSNSFVYQQERRLFIDWALEEIRASAIEPERLRYLDLGCGPGTAMEVLAEHDCTDVTGIDISEGMLQAGRRAVPGMNWIQGALERLPLRAESFDVVIAVFTVHHLAETKTFARAIELVLRRGGWCFVLDYEGSSPTFDRRFKRLAGALVSPFRFVWKRKNATALAALSVPDPGFSRAHRPRSRDEIVTALINKRDWAIKGRRHGYLIPQLHHTLVAGSRADALALNVIRFVERIFVPLGPGQLQWIAMRRL